MNDKERLFFEELQWEREQREEAKREVIREILKEEKRKEIKKVMQKKVSPYDLMDAMKIDKYTGKGRK